MNKWMLHVRSFWWRFRHEVYYYDVPVAPEVRPSTDDMTAIIQHAIDEATRQPEWFTDIYMAYKRKWYRFLLKEPVLKASVRFQPGTYSISNPIVIGGNMEIIGQGIDTTILEKKEGGQP